MYETWVPTILEDKAFVEKWCDHWTIDLDRPIAATACAHLVQSNHTIYEDRIEFYRQCIRRGAWPQPAEGIETDWAGHVVLLEGHHRASAWVREGFLWVPVRLQKGILG